MLMIRSKVFVQIHILAASLIYMKQIFAEPELKNTQNQLGCTTSKLARRNTSVHNLQGRFG
jgi:hypothetical protein